jgi:pseudaminic acid cytidylyltransferase
MGLLAVIPARSGSKRIPGKNIRPFLDRPIMAYPIAAALGAEVFSHVIVSTDTDTIADVARQCGAEVPFIRPQELSGDYVPTVDVVLHALAWAENTWGPVSHVCCLYPTAVFVTADLVRRGLECLRGTNAMSAFTVAQHRAPVLRALAITDSGGLRMLWPEYESTRSQDLPPAYYDAGQMYWTDAVTLKQERSLYTRCALPIVLRDDSVQDIDTPTDWQLAEMKYELLGGGLPAFPRSSTSKRIESNAGRSPR